SRRATTAAHRVSTGARLVGRVFIGCAVQERSSFSLGALPRLPGLRPGKGRLPACTCRPWVSRLNARATGWSPWRHVGVPDPPGTWGLPAFFEGGGAGVHAPGAVARAQAVRIPYRFSTTPTSRRLVTTRRGHERTARRTRPRGEGTLPAGRMQGFFREV